MGYLADLLWLEIIANCNMGAVCKIYLFPNEFGNSCAPDCRKENAFRMMGENNKKVPW